MSLIIRLSLPLPDGDMTESPPQDAAITPARMDRTAIVRIVCLHSPEGEELRKARDHEPPRWLIGYTSVVCRGITLLLRPGGVVPLGNCAARVLKSAVRGAADSVDARYHSTVFLRPCSKVTSGL